MKAHQFSGGVCVNCDKMQPMACDCRCISDIQEPNPHCPIHGLCASKAVQEVKPLALSRIVPAHRITERFNWVQRNFHKFGSFKAARERMNLPVQDGCWWCKTLFADDDMMALAQPEKGTNRLLCQTCVDEMEAAKP